MIGEPQTIIGPALKLRADRLAREALAGVHTVEDLADMQQRKMMESAMAEVWPVPRLDLDQ